MILTKRIGAASLACFALAALSGCSEKATTSSERVSDSAMASMPMAGDSATTASKPITLSAAQIQHAGIRWAPAQSGSSTSVVVVPGTIVPNENLTARIAAPAEGRVVAVRVQPGDRVSRGQVMVRLQSPGAGMAQSDVDKANAQVASMRAQATYARTARERAERLLAIKAIPRQDYDRAIADDQLAQASLAQALAEQRRAISSANQLGAIGSTTGEMELRSPLSGVVLTRDAQPGAVVSAGASLVSVTDPSSLWLLVNAPEKLAGLFQTGSMLHFTVPAYPGATFDARIITVGAGLDPQSRTLPVRAQILNANQRLKPEMLASVSVAAQGAAQAIVVPDAAIALMAGSSVVFIARPAANGAGTFVRRNVDVASRSGGTAVVTSGLAIGELIVVSGVFSIKAEIEKSSMAGMEM